MRVLITTFTYHPNKDGVAIASIELAEGLASNGWDVTVATALEDQPGNAVINGVKVIRFDFNRGGFNFDSASEPADDYRKFVLNGNFDVLVSQCWEVWSTVCLLPIVDSLNAKRVLVSHGFRMHVYHWYPKFAFGFLSWIKKLVLMAKILPKIISCYDSFVVLSTKKDFRNFFDHWLLQLVQPSKIRIIPNAVNLNLFSDDDSSFRAFYNLDKDKIVLSVANYCDRKNQALSLRAFRKANVPNSAMVFIGSDFNDYSESLIRLDKKLEAQYPNGKTLILQGITRDETFSAYKACDVFLLTARSETQPIVIIEAMAAGKPWVSTDTGCVKAMTGGLVGKTESQLVRIIQNYLSNENFRHDMGMKGKKAATEQHGQALYLERYEHLLKNLLGVAYRNEFSL